MYRVKGGIRDWRPSIFLGEGNSPYYTLGTGPIGLYGYGPEHGYLTRNYVFIINND